MRGRRIMVSVAGAVLVAASLTAVAAPAGAADPLDVVDPKGFLGRTWTLPPAQAGQPYSFQMQATGGVPPYTFQFRDGSQHPGITYDDPSGRIYGTPELLHEGANAIYGTRWYVTDSADPPTVLPFNRTFMVLPLPMRVLTASLPNGAVGVPYAALITAAGGNKPFKFNKAAKFPKGLSISKDGVVSGVPKQGGTYQISVRVKDALQIPRVATRSIPLTISGPGGGGGGGSVKPVITAQGDVRCSGPVTMKLAMNGNAPNYYAVGFFKGTLGCSGSSGHPAVTPTQVKVSGTFNHSGGCAVYGVHDRSGSSTTSVSDLSLLWKAKGGTMLGSSVSYSNFRASGFGWQLPAAFTAGTSQVIGSYAGQGTSSATMASAIASAIQAGCGSTTDKVTVGGTLTINL